SSVGPYFYKVAWANVQDIAAAPLATGGSVYLSFTNGSVMHHTGFNSGSGVSWTQDGLWYSSYDKWTYVTSGASQLSASDWLMGGSVFSNRPDSGSVFVVDQSGQMTEYWWTTAGPQQLYLAYGVTGIDAAMPHGANQNDTAFTEGNVFVQFND